MINIAVSHLDSQYKSRFRDISVCPAKFSLTMINPIALRKAKILYNFGLSECSMVNRKQDFSVSQTLISQSTSYSFGHSLYLHWNPCCLKLLVFKSKFSGTRKFTLRYQYFRMNFDFEILRVDCISSLLLSAFVNFYRVFLSRLPQAWRDIGIRFSVRSSIHTYVRPSTFAITLVLTLLFKSVTLKPYEILQQNLV